MKKMAPRLLATGVALALGLSGFAAAAPYVYIPLLGPAPSGSGKALSLIAADASSPNLTFSAPVVISALPSQSLRVVGVAVNSQYVYASDGAGTVYEFASGLPAGETPVQMTLSPSATLYALALNKDGSELYATDYSGGCVYRVKIAASTPGELPQLSEEGSPLCGLSNPFGVAVNPASGDIYVVNNNFVPEANGSVSVIDSGTFKVKASYTVGKGPVAIAVSADGTTAYVGNQTDSTISVLNLASPATPVPAFPVPGVRPNGIAVLPSGSLVVANLMGAPVLVKNPTNPNPTITSLGTAGPAFGITVSPDGNAVFLNNVPYQQTFEVITNAEGATPVVTSSSAFPPGKKVAAVPELGNFAG